MPYTFNQPDTAFASYNPNVGQKQAQQPIWFCEKCGSANPIGMPKCPRCGHKKKGADKKTVLLIALSALVLCLMIAMIFLLISFNELRVTNTSSQAVQSYNSSSANAKSNSSSANSANDQSNSNASSNSSNNSSSSSGGSQTTSTNQRISVGQEVTTEDWSFIVPVVEWRDEVYTLSDNMFGQYLPDESGKSYYFMELDYKNLSGSPYRFNDFIKVELKFNDKYTIPTQFYDPYSSIFSQYFSCEVMVSTPGYMIASVSDDIRNNFTSCKIVLTMKTPKTSYEINL